MIRAAAALAALAALGSAGTAPAQLVVRDLYLMGTRARVAAVAADRHAGLEVIERAVRVLEGTEAELSTWRDDSVVSALNRRPINQALPLPATLCDTFAALTEWHAATARAFDPAIGRLTDAWGIHAGGRVPPAPILRDARATSGLHHFLFDRSRCLVTRRADATIDVGGFGKGDALDRVVHVLGEASWMIDLGGQVAVHGAEPRRRAWSVAIAHPRDRQRAFLELQLRDGSVSTSAGSERDESVNGRRVGHILDPRTGQPAAFDGSVTVWHQQALVADILSTALYVMGPDEGLHFAEQRGIAACFLVPKANGNVWTEMSQAFKRLLF